MNEVRLIDANALKVAIEKKYNKEMKHVVVSFDEMTDNFTWLDEIYLAPTIEPDAIKELGSKTLEIIKDILPQIVSQSARIVRPSADWIEFKYGLFYCSNCFDKVDKDIDRIEHLVAKRDLSPFCPFCGSLMKGKGKAYE